mmetsp:Transcript_15789/g.29792  ORF Transcript_15789/g.29792 Transcript_15789/m.29792 type:complete len:776 (-) Transcript_15789:1993-4320(-)|eukprot:CAMPEP_0176501170 /NCGR_PEP_ID=MMETSP0200_2-20121128/14008_1 /TAXON_ID=947934 /ORGANISM="Chaetoceros sp., Strain GSL56" /LENGTH=775 /DNA_ID=CAMNT_0017900019 /DNA_START=272 /DNA_END=2599 /DNA_ORIENTATION=-
MGKQSRRKGNAKKNLSSPRTTATAQPSKSSLVNRIRHGDLRVRHGALTAASATLFSPLSLSSRSPVNMEVIQAVSERVMDEDAPCALCALGCLGNYVLFQERHTHGNKVETLLTPILLTKMNKACDSIEATAKQMMQEQQTSNSENSSGNAQSLERLTLSIMEQWSVQSLCLHALCGIVEGTAANNESSSILFHQRDEFLMTVMRSFYLATEMITGLANIGIANCDSEMKRDIAMKEHQTNIISDVAVYAARTIHSSSDENPTFLASVMTSDGWKTIVSCISNATLPMLARLHCCGITMISRQVSKAKEVEQIVFEQSLPVLSQCIIYSNEVASELHKKIIETFQKMKEEKDDEKVEKDIIRKVDKRKESARLIARRQKQMKQQSKYSEQINDTDNTDKTQMIDDVKKKEVSQVEATDETKAEKEEHFDKALTEWKNTCLPLQLSIEIMTNAFALAQDEANAPIDDYDEMAWDSDQEDKLQNDIPGTLPAFNISKEDEVFFQQVVNLGTPDRALSLFGAIYTALVTSGKNSDNIHFEILNDLTDILSKSTICLGNMFSILQNFWKSSENDSCAIWNDLTQCLRASKDENMNKPIMFQLIAAALSVMVALLRSRPTLMKWVNEKDLEMLLSLVLTENPEVGKTDEEVAATVSDIQKDSITMLGILCSEPHPESVNERVCETFLTLLLRTHSITTNVMSEVLNVLMDMYSADEGDANNHEAVFRRNNVLSAFQKSVPILKRKVREEESKESISREEELVLKEIILNATRFVKYKKGH